MLGLKLICISKRGPWRPGPDDAKGHGINSHTLDEYSGLNIRKINVWATKHAHNLKMQTDRWY